MTARERLQRVVDLVDIPGTDSPVVHDLGESIASLCTTWRKLWLTDVQKVRAQASDEPFQEHLEDCSRDQGVKQANDCIVNILLSISMIS